MSVHVLGLAVRRMYQAATTCPETLSAPSLPRMYQVQPRHQQCLQVLILVRPLALRWHALAISIPPAMLSVFPLDAARCPTLRSTAGSQVVEPSVRKLLPEGELKACTPQHVPAAPCPSHAPTPSTLSPVLHTPSAAGSTGQVTTACHARSDVIQHSYCKGAPVHDATPPPTGDCHTPRGCAAPCPSGALASGQYRHSPETSEGCPASEVKPHSASHNRLGMAEISRPCSSGGALIEVPDAVPTSKHANRAPSKDDSAPQPVHARVLKDASPVQDLCTHNAATPPSFLSPQSSPLDILASVAAIVAPESATDMVIPYVHEQAPAASPHHCPNLVAPATVLARALPEQCFIPASDSIPSPRAAHHQPKASPARAPFPAVPPPASQIGAYLRCSVRINNHDMSQRVYSNEYCSAVTRT